MKKILYVCLFIVGTLPLTGCFNTEQKANEIIDYLSEIRMLEEKSKPIVDTFSSNMRDITKRGDIADMIQLIEGDIMPTFEEHIEGIDQIELDYRATKKIRELHLELLNEALSYYEWQVEVLHAESPENELEEIMKEEAGIFGLKTERDLDSYYMKGVSEIEKKKRAFERELDHYWDIYHIDDYMEE